MPNNPEAATETGSARSTPSLSDQETFLTRKKKARWAILYVAVVLAVDSLAALHVTFPFPWDWFQWQSREVAQIFSTLHFPEGAYAWLLQPGMTGFDWFKFLCWFVIPFCFGIGQMDWRWLGWRGCTRNDWLFLLGLFVVGGLAILLIPYLPVVKDYYTSRAHLSETAKWNQFSRQMFWVISWLFGWEFLHRYMLLRRVDNCWPRFGWLLVPLAETLYHLQKPPLEMLGMLIFSLLLTQWARKRNSMLLPFLAHAYIEVILIIYLLLR